MNNTYCKGVNLIQDLGNLTSNIALSECTLYQLMTFLTTINLCSTISLYI